MPPQMLFDGLHNEVYNLPYTGISDGYGWESWANLNCNENNTNGKITYTGNWGATAG